MESSQSKQKPCERTRGYWIVNNHSGTKKSCGVFYCKIIVLRFKCLIHTYLCSMRGWVGNGIGERQRQWTQITFASPVVSPKTKSFILWEGDVIFYIKALQKIPNDIDPWNREQTTPKLSFKAKKKKKFLIWIPNFRMKRLDSDGFLPAERF